MSITKIKVNLSLSGRQLNQHIIESACKDLDFLNARSKLKTIEKTLGKDLTGIISQRQLLLVNVKVSNILQHAVGIISNEDLTDLGIASITEDHGDPIVSIFARQKVTRTAFDIENLTDALIQIANTLIP